MFLTPDELVELTGRKRVDAQARELNLLGIVFKPRSDGTLAVLKAHVEGEFGVLPAHSRMVRDVEINLEGLNA